jgi:hypothetical protein
MLLNVQLPSRNVYNHAKETGLRYAMPPVIQKRLVILVDISRALRRYIDDPPVRHRYAIQDNACSGVTCRYSRVVICGIV